MRPTWHLAAARDSRRRRALLAQHQILARSLGEHVAKRLQAIPSRVQRGTWDKADHDQLNRDAVMAGHFARLAVLQTSQIEL